jgi:hypothetical protein
MKDETERLISSLCLPPSSLFFAPPRQRNRYGDHFLSITTVTNPLTAYGV